MTQRQTKPQASNGWSGKRYLNSQKTNTNGQGSRRGSTIQLSKPKLWLRWLVVGVVVSILFYQFGYVRDIQVQGANTFSENESIHKLVSNNLNYLTRIKPFLDEQKLSDVISQQGLYSSVSVKPSIWNGKLFVSIVPHQVAAWLKQGDSEPTIAISREGVLFQYPISADVESLPKIEDKLKAADSPGEVISAQTISFVNEFDQGLKGDWEKRYYQIGSAPRELILVDSSKSYVVKVSIERSAADQLEELSQIEEYLKKRGVKPDSYIDLRVDNTAYYQ